MMGVPTLLLRTTGRRPGATRTNGLVYARDDDDYLVVASNGGAPIVLRRGCITSAERTGRDSDRPGAPEGHSEGGRADGSWLCGSVERRKRKQSGSL